MTGGTLRQKLDRGAFVITADVAPPKGIQLDMMRERVARMKDAVDAVNVPDNQGSVMRLSSVGGACVVGEMGAEPILQVSCRDRNRLAIQSDLLFASSRGIGNVLCLTGDSVVLGDHPQAGGVFDLDSTQLLQLLGTMEEGLDLGGNRLDGSPVFFKGATVAPGARPLGPQMLRFERKVEAGAEFFQTQVIFDLDTLRRFMDRARRTRVKILAGILVLASARMARRFNARVPGVRVPGALVEELEKAPRGSAGKRGMEIAAGMIRQIREQGICDGVHVMTAGREDVVPEVLELAGVSGEGSRGL
jgi:methylenetetrahydrofolate reductase (NADPH)